QHRQVMAVSHTDPGKAHGRFPWFWGGTRSPREMQTSRNHAKRQIKLISFDFGSFRAGISPILLKTLRPPPRLPRPELRASYRAHPHRPRSTRRTTRPPPPAQHPRVCPSGGKPPARPAYAAHPTPHTRRDDGRASTVSPPQIVQLHE